MTTTVAVKLFFSLEEWDGVKKRVKFLKMSTQRKNFKIDFLYVSLSIVLEVLTKKWDVHDDFIHKIYSKDGNNLV